MEISVLIKKKKKKAKNYQYQDEKGNITTNSKDIQMITREYCEQLLRNRMFHNFKVSLHNTFVKHKGKKCIFTIE